MAAELLKDLVEEKYHSNYQTLVTQSLDDILQHQREYPGHYIDDNIHPEERFRYPLPDISKAQELRAYFAGLDS
jgi:hypothetical protein